eukprot:TRINITY_DN5916_c0_g1_i1.p1 TRINITY_DN5916_c0_g1~~TRINITY_DN5916_c0_g1_i1.p1  ORF type:complete len:102 (+),score=6.97 TRINITY_DN5916_c0_g1_i1:157-462(+)
MWTCTVHLKVSFKVGCYGHESTNCMPKYRSVAHQSLLNVSRFCTSKIFSSVCFIISTLPAVARVVFETHVRFVRPDAQSKLFSGGPSWSICRIEMQVSSSS